MTQLPFANQTYERNKYGLPPQTCMNMYAEQSPIPGKQITLLCTPGLKVFAEIGQGPIRGMYQSDGVLNNRFYVISGNEIYSVDKAGVGTFIGDIAGEGIVSIAASATQIAIASDGKGYIIQLDGVNQITDTDFPDVESVAYISGFFWWVVKTSGQHIWSKVLDAYDYDALDFATAENAPDNLRTIHIDHGQGMLIGAETMEPWVVTGKLDSPFEPIPSAIIDKGCINRNSVASLDNTFFFVGNDLLVYRMGEGPERISTVVIGEVLDSLDESELVNVNGWSYSQDDHTFYCLDIPGHSTYCYDLLTGLWHERKSFGKDLFEPWVVNQSKTTDRVFNKVLVGSRNTGHIYELDKDTPTYNQDNIERAATAGYVIEDGRPEISSVTLDITVGVGTSLGDGVDPKVMLQWSDNLGRTWSNERWVSMGKIGEYDKLVTFRRLGQSKPLGRVFRFRVTDPVIFAMNGARINLDKP